MRGFCVHFLTENYFQVPTVYLGRICYWATKYRRKPTAPITASRATWYNYLYIQFLEQKEANQRRHVTSDSQSSDRSGRRLGSYLSQIFFAKKPLNFKEINPQFGLLSQSILRKSSQFFTESTCSPTSKVYRNLQRRP